jgi:beta-lactamase class A
MPLNLSKLSGIVVFSFLLTAPLLSFSQKEKFQKQIDQIIKSSSGIVGFAVMGLESGEEYVVNGSHKFPMQSVFKFPLAMAVLDQVDQGKLRLDQKIHVAKADLLPNTWSPLRDKYPDGEVDIALSEIVALTVSLSDNNGCDILFRLLGGPGQVDKYMKGLLVDGIAIVATEAEMSRHWDVQFTNWCTPSAMLRLLEVFYSGKKLSPTSHAFLMKVLVETTTAPNRLRGMLPKETVVAHKTGTSGANDRGIAAATNDVGIITLPNGKHLAIVAFVSNSNQRTEDRDLVIARLTKSAFDYYSTK